MGAPMAHGSRGLDSVPPILTFLCCVGAWLACCYKIFGPVEGQRKWPHEVASRGPWP